MADTEEKNRKSRTRRTLRDVAEVAHVSEMTVSRVLTGKPGVAPATKEKILRIIDDLGYVPNRLAGSLATSRSNQVAVIIPSLINNVFPEVTSGIADSLERAGYNAVVGITDYNPVKEESLIRSMMSWRPAGFIVAGHNSTTRTQNMLRNADIPVVEIMDIPDEPVDICIGLYQKEAARALARHLVAKGYRSFGYVGLNDRDSSAAKRFSAMQEILLQTELSIDHRALFDQPPDMVMGKQGVIDLLAENPNLDVVVFSNDTAAIGAYMHCIEKGIEVPEQLAIAGFSGLNTGQTMPKKLTTIATKRYEIGRLAARAVINELDGQNVTRLVDLGFELIEGETA